MATKQYVAVRWLITLNFFYTLSLYSLYSIHSLDSGLWSLSILPLLYSLPSTFSLLYPLSLSCLSLLYPLLSTPYTSLSHSHYSLLSTLYSLSSILYSLYTLYCHVLVM